MKTYQTRIVKLAVVPEGEPIYALGVTDVEIIDESGGEFVKVSQEPDGGTTQAILIDPDEWPAIRAAINRMVGMCRPEAP